MVETISGKVRVQPERRSACPNQGVNDDIPTDVWGADGPPVSPRCGNVFPEQSESYQAMAGWLRGLARNAGLQFSQQRNPLGQSGISPGGCPPTLSQPPKNAKTATFW
jgi:hypothetical protein